MQKKLLLSYFIIIALVLLTSITSFWTHGYKFMNNQSENYYIMQAQLLADSFEEQELKREEYSDFIEKKGEKYNIRITLIDSKGNVIEDTMKEPLENHSTREEVASALEGKSVVVKRYSKTMGQKYSYSAVPVVTDTFNGVLRVSVPLDEITALDENLSESIAGTIFFSLVIVCIVAYLYSRMLAKPMNEITDAAKKVAEGDYNIKIYTDETGQIGVLAEAFNSMTKNLKSNILALTQRNHELSAMLSSITSGVVAVDDGNLILFYNQPFVDITEAKSGDLNEKSLYSVIRSSVIFDAMEEVKASNNLVIREGVLNVSKDKILKVTATPISQLKEKSNGTLLILDDITKVRKLENMRSDFVSNVTHELKTPLTSIRGFIDTLKNGAIKDEVVAHKFLDIIDVEAERLYSLIQDILLLSEIESAKDQEIMLCRVDKIIGEVVELLNQKVHENVTLIYEPEPVKLYSCNPDRMKQLIINLVDNAIKYTEEGTIKIECREENNKLLIRVSDTGIGMAREHLERIFERFYRVDKGRGRKQGGTGLGLSIVKHIVELYNGNIRVDSKENEGTTFEIRLPY